MRRTFDVLIGLGSNIEPETNIRMAVERLSEVLAVSAVSSAYRSPPVAAPGTARFINAALLVRTAIGPRTLKFKVLRTVERSLGRHRGPDRNAPRTIDLDLLVYGDLVIDSRDLSVPDPDLSLAAHVGVPAAEILPNWAHPTLGDTLAGLVGSLEGNLERVDGLDLKATVRQAQRLS